MTTSTYFGSSSTSRAWRPAFSQAIRVEPEPNQRQLDARRRVHEALEALGGISSPAGSCIWHAVGLQKSVRQWAVRQGSGGRPVRQEEAKGILVAALGMLVAHVGYGAAKRAS